MRRALVLAAVLLAALAAGVPTLAAGAGQEVERELGFALRAEGFAVQVFVTNNDGEVTATIFVNRGPQIAYYSAPAKVTAKRVTARFGSLGELDYTFAAKGGGKIDCVGSEDGEASFDGTFVFTGENGYVHVEADHAEGSFQVYPAPKDCPSARLDRRVVPYHPSYSSEGLTLQAQSGSRARGVVRGLTVSDPGGKRAHGVYVFADLAELREGMTVARGVRLRMKSSGFRWSLERGTATLRPPAPFTGSATFTRHGDRGRGTWKGTLGMPILGGEPVKLSGGGFRAFVHRGVQQDE